MKNNHNKKDRESVMPSFIVLFKFKATLQTLLYPSAFFNSTTFTKIKRKTITTFFDLTVYRIDPNLYRDKQC